MTMRFGRSTRFLALVVLMMATVATVLLCVADHSDAASARGRRVKREPVTLKVEEDPSVSSPAPPTNVLPGIQITLANSLVSFLQNILPAFVPKQFGPLAPITSTVDGVTISVSDLTFTNISIGKPEIGFTSGILFDTAGMSANVIDMTWAYKTNFISDQGNANITLQGVSLNLLFGINETHGNPQIVEQSSSLEIQTLKFNFYANLGWLYNVLTADLGGIIKSKLGGEIPVALKGLNQALLNLTMTQTLYEVPEIKQNVTLDYHLTGPANFSDGLMTLGLEGLINFARYNYPTNIKPPVEMPTNVTGKMAQVFVSDFVANAAFQNTFPIYESFGLASILPTNTCATTATLLFGSNICSYGNNGTLNYEIQFDSPPTWTTTTSNPPITLFTNTTISVFAKNATVNETLAVKFNLALTLQLTLNINSANFSASIAGASASATVIENPIGPVSGLGFKITLAINAAKSEIDQKLVFSIYDAITKTHGIELVTPTVGYGNGYFYISTDVTVM